MFANMYVYFVLQILHFTLLKPQAITISEKAYSDNDLTRHSKFFNVLHFCVIQVINQQINSNYLVLTTYSIARKLGHKLLIHLVGCFQKNSISMHCVVFSLNDIFFIFQYVGFNQGCVCLYALSMVTLKAIRMHSKKSWSFSLWTQD